MKHYVEVNLSPAELMLCAQAGVMRNVENIKKNYHNKYNMPSNAPLWHWHIEGCIGEYVVSKHLGLLWKGKGEPNTPDLINGDEVRISDLHTNRLIVHPNDAEDASFWFVTGSNGTYRINGWIKGHKAKDQKYWADPNGGRPAYFVPLEDLESPHRKG